jgi:hypothetical protein
MKKSIKKTVATIIILTFVSINAWAEGDMQCPKTAAPCLVETTLPDTKGVSNEKSQFTDDFAQVVLKMLRQISFLF